MTNRVLHTLLVYILCILRFSFYQRGAHQGRFLLGMCIHPWSLMPKLLFVHMVHIQLQIWLVLFHQYKAYIQEPQKLHERILPCKYMMFQKDSKSDLLHMVCKQKTQYQTFPSAYN